MNCPVCNQKMKYYKKYDVYCCNWCDKCYTSKGTRSSISTWELKRNRAISHISPVFLTWVISLVIAIALMIYGYVSNTFDKDAKAAILLLLCPLLPTFIAWQITMSDDERARYERANERRKQQKLEAQRQKQQVDIPSSYRCPSCQELISNKAESCPHCGYVTGVHVCPKCGSVDTRVISGTNKAASVLVFGVLAANNVVKTYKCNKCGTKF